MGLRINTNISALTALRNLSINGRQQADSLERLSTGLRINRASDDPSGLVISEQLRAQLAALDQAIINTETSSNLVATADAALQELADLLVDVQDSLVFAMNTGGSSPAQIAAEQAGVDQAISAIDRIAATTRFADRSLLNGTADYMLTAPRPPQLQNLTVRSLSIAGGIDETVTFTITPREAPQRGEIRFQSVSSVAAGTVLRVTGARGTEDILVLSGVGTAAARNLRDSINQVAGFTGVYASAAGTTVSVVTEEFGVAQSVRLELIEGEISGATAIQTLSGGQVVGTVAKAYTAASGVGPNGQMVAGDIIVDRGRDARAAFQGQEFRGVGRSFSILARVAQFQFDLNPDLIVSAAGGAGNLAMGSGINFTVGNTGLRFQLNEFNRPTDQINVGIAAVNSAFLGFEEHRDKIAEAGLGAASVSAGALSSAQVLRGGFLNTLRTGGDNDLFTNPGNAADITKASINQVAGLRGYLGAIVAGNLDPNVRTLGVHTENLRASLADIRDLDFASETANFVRTQILFQSNIAVLANANVVPQAVLNLLGG